MGQPAAKQGDQITATDIHIIMIPSPTGPVPTPLPHPFSGIINGGLSSDVIIEGMPAA
ncbi:MAG: PAAR domain-containing protein, partial [Dehalococcoidia bacterium]